MVSMPYFASAQLFPQPSASVTLVASVGCGGSLFQLLCGCVCFAGFNFCFGVNALFVMCLSFCLCAAVAAASASTLLCHTCCYVLVSMSICFNWWCGSVCFVCFNLSWCQFLGVMSLLFRSSSSSSSSSSISCGSSNVVVVEVVVVLLLLLLL